LWSSFMVKTILQGGPVQWGWITQAPLNPIVYIQDMGFYDNALWSIATINNNYRIVRIDISPVNFGKVELGATKQAPDILSFTSIFSAKNGVYGYDENNGHFVR